MPLRSLSVVRLSGEEKNENGGTKVKTVKISSSSVASK